MVLTSESAGEILEILKDGASFCYRAYVLRISACSEELGFLRDGVLYQYKGILHKTMQEKQILARASCCNAKRKLG